MVRASCVSGRSVYLLLRPLICFQSCLGRVRNVMLSSVCCQRCFCRCAMSVVISVLSVCILASVSAVSGCCLRCLRVCIFCLISFVNVGL